MSKIPALTQRLLAGGASITKEELLALLSVPDGSEDFRALMAGADTIRKRFRGDGVYLCTILNAKAGGCSEDCAYCAQTHKNMPQTQGWIDAPDLSKAIDESREQRASCLGLVAAWRGLHPGKTLDAVCDSFQALKSKACDGHASLGLLPSVQVAKRLAQAGATVYHHNLETSASFYPQICTTHTYAQRLETIAYARQAGMKICSGGIFGLGESIQQRAEFLMELAALVPESVPLNFFNPVPGSALAHRSPLPPGEALAALATARFALPKQRIMLCGGKEVTLGKRLSDALDAGCDGLMVGNYLTSPGTSSEWWQTEIHKRGRTLTTAF